jgi:hypothetical protein
MQLPGWADRVTDRARSAATQALHQHTSLGRLSPEEFAQRGEQVTQAQRNEEIDALFADLPQPHPRFAVNRLSAAGCVALLAWVASVVSAVIALDNGNWLAFYLLTPLSPLLMGLNWVVVRRRLAKASSSPHEQQRRLLRYQQADLDRLRLSTHERAGVPDTLVLHLAAGQLTRDDYDARVSQVAGLRTRGDLRELLGTLPPPEPALADTALTVDYETPPHGPMLALAMLAWLPGLPLAIAGWVALGQWYWVPVWAIVVTALGLRHKLNPNHINRKERLRKVR